MNPSPWRERQHCGVKRRLFNAGSLVSLALCVAACVLWVRSYVVVDGWTWSDGVRVPTAGYPVAWRSAILSDRGSIHFIRDRSMGASAYSRRLLPREADFLPRLDASHSRLGGGYQARSGYPLIASVAVGPPVVLTRVWAFPL